MIEIGDKLPEINMPLTLHRLVMEAGVNRDLSMIHHDKAVAQSTGANDAYANTFFLMALFERQLRSLMGSQGSINKLGPMRMMGFNCVGDNLCVKGEITEKNGNQFTVSQTIENNGTVTTSCISIITL